MCFNYNIIIILTEIWLNSSVAKTELFDVRYNVHRRERETSCINNFKERGGMLISISNQLNSYRVNERESQCEDLRVTLTVPSSATKLQLALSATYLPVPVNKCKMELFVDNCNKVSELHDYFTCVISI